MAKTSAPLLWIFGRLCLLVLTRKKQECMHKSENCFLSRSAVTLVKTLAGKPGYQVENAKRW